jgi:hypothetical protein
VSTKAFPPDKAGGTSQFARSVYRDGEFVAQGPFATHYLTNHGKGIVYYVYLFGKRLLDTETQTGSLALEDGS